ncbi:MAG: RICIN domain-containing protein [Clostridia bacterium]|nr:RICIN domain-containing protein [Clostridia bacterium]
MKRSRKVFSIVLIIVLLLESLSLLAFASDNPDTDIPEPERVAKPEESVPLALREISSRRTENSVHFFLGDGLSEVISFLRPVHRQDADGNWNIIDNELIPAEISENYRSFKTKDGAFYVSLTESVVSVSINRSDYSVTQTVETINKKQPDISVENGKAIAPVEPLYSIEQAGDYYKTNISESTVTCTGLLENADIEYIITGNDITESFVINDPSRSYGYSVILNLSGSELKRTEGGTYTIVSEKTGESLYTINHIIMTDAEGSSNDSVHTDVEIVSDGKYRISLIPDVEWMSSDDREFPVRFSFDLRQSTYDESSEYGETHEDYYEGYYTTVYSEPQITEGVYYLKNYSSGKYLECNGTGLDSGTTLSQSAKSEGSRNQLFKITYIMDYGTDHYYNIRLMTNSGLGLYAPSTAGTSSQVTATTVSSGDGWYSFTQWQRWAIRRNTGSTTYRIQNAFIDNGGYLSAAGTTNGAEVRAIRPATSLSDWILEEYTGAEIDGVTAVTMPRAVYTGRNYALKVCMYSSRIGVNGPVTYSVSSTSYTSTDKATVNTSTGVLTTLYSGQVKVGVTYQGAPWVWYWTVRIAMYYGCRDYLEISSRNDPLYSQMNCLGYAFNITNCTNISLWDNQYVYNMALRVAEPDDLLEIALSNLSVFLDDAIGENNWECVTNQGGINATLSDNQWLVAMRVGLHSEGDINTYVFADYHFWYRTSSGEWANKHGIDSYSQILGNNLPTDDDSIGWSMDGITGFYDSRIEYFRITDPNL